MNIKAEKIENNVVKLEVTVPAERFDKAMQEAYRKNAGKFNIPGFRKGKAPMAIIEKMYGPEVFYEDAAYIIYEETYPVVLEEKDVHPVDYPKIDIVQSSKGTDFIYTAEVTVKPEVKLGQYKDLEVKKIEYPVTDESVDAQLNSMRERNSRIINKEESPVENGDIVIIDFEGFIDETAFEGGKAEAYELTVGSGSFIPGFEEQLIGAKAGDEIEVNVSFPEDYHAEELKGKPALFKVKVNEVKTKEMPALDDEFAKDVSEFDTLEELKADLRKKQEESNSERAKRDFEDAVVKAAVEACEVEIPEVMIEREIDYMVKDLDYRLKYQNLTVDKYVELLGITMDALRSDFKDTAKDRVKTTLVLEAIAKVESIEVAEEDIENRAEEIAKQYGTKDLEKMKKSILKTQKDIIKEELANNKVVELLVSSSKEVE